MDQIRHVYRPLDCLKLTSAVRFPLILLNQPFSHQQKHLDVLWEQSSLQAVTDGANNSLYELMKAENTTRFVPDLVTGDFDSIREEVKSFMEEKGSKIIHTPDQDKTDFRKCLEIVADQVKNEKVDFVVAFGAFGGRLDHVLSNINTLFEAPSIIKYPLYLIGDYNISFLLMPGHHTIDISSGLEGSTCGLFPLGGKCEGITTTGLKWNLNQDQMEFGGLISSCNTYEKDATEVTVENNSPILWTMDIAK
ncbi:thiamine pyrophosphokinase 1-like isoform X2 [Apostichopus japonicus]|uniref:thiamine pyrophosphokinase 1-like isoform X2 n=1 Tax=Stichopus japonicus TaxID=307972 RepID=UPI003AB6A668